MINKLLGRNVHHNELIRLKYDSGNGSSTKDVRQMGRGQRSTGSPAKVQAPGQTPASTEICPKSAGVLQNFFT